MRSAGRFWLAFALCAVAALAGMGWITVHVLALERAEVQARVQSAHMDEVRLALWRMDSWLNTQLAPEAARPYFDYRAFHDQQRAWTRGLGAIAPGEVVTPSPLLTFRSELFPLHFQLGADGDLTSPQLPTGNERDLAEGTLGLDGDVAVRTAQLGDLGRFVRYGSLGVRLGQAALLPTNCIPADLPPLATARDRDFENRSRQSIDAKNPVQQQASWNGVANVETAPGPLLPIWLDAADGDARLVFARRVDIAGTTVFQGFAVDWPRLEAALLAQIEDLFADARLVRQDQPDDAHRPRLLATVPACLEVPAPSCAPPGWTPTRTVLATAWAAILVAVLAIGATLGSALSFGQKRARFASAVTHELRSPLTTFRMYSEMLAEGMVPDEARRAEYVQTLCRESERLSRLVENVLAYARIEDGRQHLRRQRLALGALVDRVRPVLERRTSEAGFALRVAVADPDAVVDVDPDAVEQVLFGLCDNACKYAADGPGERAVELEAARAKDTVELRVRDHGPGIPAEHRRAVFRAFERGARPTGESVIPGVGLGLALAQSLARELGGALVLDADTRDGAAFVLRLPAVG